MSPADNHIQIIVTLGSGNGSARSTAQRLQNALLRRGYETHIETFADLDPLLRWAATCTPTFSHLMCVGGDATLSAAAGAAVRLRIPFLPVPNGFGNIFARAFGHSDQTDQVMEQFESGHVHDVDVGTVNQEQIFLSNRSYGILGEVKQAVERGQAQPKSRMLRHLAYYAMARRYLFTAPLPAIRLEVDGTLLAEDAPIVIVANVESFRGYLNLTPTASPMDGLLDVFAVPRSTRLEMWRRLFTLMLGLPGRWNGVMLCRGRRVRVTAEGSAPEELAVRRNVLPLLIPSGSLERLRVRLGEADVPGGVLAPATLKVMARRGAARRPHTKLARAPRRARGSPRRSTRLAGRGVRG